MKKKEIEYYHFVNSDGNNGSRQLSSRTVNKKNDNNASLSAGGLTIPYEVFSPHHPESNLSQTKPLEPKRSLQVVKETEKHVN